MILHIRKPCNSGTEVPVPDGIGIEGAVFVTDRSYLEGYYRIEASKFLLLYYLFSMKHLGYLLILFTLFSCREIEFQEHPDVEIARDEWGAPHIHGKTDIDVVYGLAWAQCEDDFVTLQEQLLAAKGMLGEVNGQGWNCG
jgi:hypothetical protein